MKKVEAKTFYAKDEPKFWTWLGDAYVSSEDSSDGETEITVINIKTPDGIKYAMDGDVITRDADGNFRVFTNEQFEKEHLTHICLVTE